MCNRYWCATSFNYNQTALKSLGTITNVRYSIWQLEECPTTGKIHAQIYLQLFNRVRITTVQKLIGDATAHVEAAKGDPDANIAYCSKIDTRHSEPTITGEPMRPGKRTDLIEACETIKQGATFLEIAEKHPTELVKYTRGLSTLKSIYDKQNTKEFRHIHCLVLWGAAGTGKTRKAYELHPNLYKLAAPKGDTLWWDGYDGEDTILLDDFYGWVKYHDLLHILDGYQLRLEIKGSTTWANWTTVIITSNKPPKSWYCHGMTPALQRRISDCVEVSQGSGVILDPLPSDTDDSDC